MMKETMKRPLFTVSVSDRFYGDSSPITLQEEGLKTNLELASTLGFEGVEIQIHTPSNYVWEKIAQQTQELNLTVTAFGTGLEYGVNGLSFTSRDESVRQRTQERFMEYITVASKFDAAVFLGLCRGTSPRFSTRKEYLDLLYRQFLPLCEHAQNLGVLLVLEPIVFYLTTLLNTTHETLEFLERPGLEQMELLLDTHHMFIEDADYIQSFRDAAGQIGHLHISDSNRKYPGCGNVDYTAVGEVLKEIGYSNPVSLETLPYPTSKEGARIGLEWMKNTWSA